MIPLWVGSVIVGFVLAVISYFVTRWAVIAYRKRWPHPRPKYLTSLDQSAPSGPTPQTSQIGDADATPQAAETSRVQDTDDSQTASDDKARSDNPESPIDAVAERE